MPQINTNRRTKFQWILPSDIKFTSYGTVDDLLLTNLEIYMHIYDVIFELIFKQTKIMANLCFLFLQLDDWTETHLQSSKAILFVIDYMIE